MHIRTKINFYHLYKYEVLLCINVYKYEVDTNRGVGKLFCKGPKNKYFRLCRFLTTTHNSALQCSMKAAAGNTQMNDVATFQ